MYYSNNVADYELPGGNYAVWNKFLLLLYKVQGWKSEIQSAIKSKNVFRVLFREGEVIKERKRLRE